MDGAEDGGRGMAVALEEGSNDIDGISVVLETTTASLPAHQTGL